MKTLFPIALLAVITTVLQPADAAAADKVDYATQIKPILEASCTKCHGEKRQLGDLALHTDALAGVIEDGYILEGDAESSSVYERLTLEPDDKLLMPKGGDPLPKEQIALIEQWINEGAVLTSAEATPEPMAHGEDEHAAGEAEPMPAPPAADESRVQAIADMGASIVPLYQGSTLLSISFPSNPQQVTDESIDAIAAVGPNVAWLSLGGTAVTDAGVAKLAAACPNLSRLHLEKTATTDASADALTGLQRLEYLNLYGTAITDATVAKAAALPKLQRLYVWQTPVTYDAAKQAMAAHEGLEINLGWDHPGVVRERLTSELERVSTRKAEAAERAKQAEAQLAEAKQQLESSAAREEEIKQELQALDSPPEEAKEAPAEGATEASEPQDA